MLNTSKRSPRRVAGALTAAALLVAACGGGSDSGESADAGDPVAEVESETSDETGDAESNASAGESDTAEAVADVETEVVTEPAGPAQGAAVVQENGPIEVVGDPLAPYDSTIPDDAVGTMAPVLNGESFDGTPITIGGASDNATMVVFLAHWCPHCNDEVPELVSLNDAGSIPDDLDVVGVSTAVDPGRDNFPPSQWIVDKGWPWPTMADDDVLSAIAALGGTAFPFTVILDADGTVLARRGGQATAEQTLDFIDTALAG